MRSESNPERYFLARSLAPDLVRPEDIIEYDLDSNAVADERESVRERFIHGAVYTARPEIQAVVHSHAAAVIPFSVTRVPMRPIFHMAAFVGEGVPVFEIRDVQGGTDLLVKTPGLGRALAAVLSDKPAALMRGHGSVVVGENLPRAVGRAIYLDLSAHMQMQAIALAGATTAVTYLDEDEVRASAPPQDYGRAWPLWRARALKQMQDEA